MTDTLITDNRDYRKKRFSASRWSLIVAVVVGVLMLVFWLVTSSAEPEGPTLASQLQEQQRAFDQLNGEVNSLQQNRDAQALVQKQRAMQFDALLQRVEQLETYREDSQGENLLEQIAALSTRLDELSSAVDVRFNAALEKQHRLESAVEDARERRASAKSTQQSTEPTPAKRRPTPPSPPFTVAGLELRGGRSYLAVAAGRIDSLNDIRLISEGQSVGNWHLTSIDGHSALFSVNGQRVVVPAP